MLEYPMINRRHGTHTNIWVVALCMYCLIMRGRIADTKSRLKRKIYGHVFLTVGTPIERTKYSRHLKDTILWCLAVNPDDRPAPRQLVKHIQNVIKLHFPEAPPPERPLHDGDDPLNSRKPSQDEDSSSPLSDLAYMFEGIDIANVAPDVGIRGNREPESEEKRFNGDMELRPRKSLKRSQRYGFEEEDGEGKGGEGGGERKNKRRKVSATRKWW
ncbi:hypothetical protein F5884DRAFT_303917 [Xylogone sp. PMI_703]|nr:hypothetical protein F5884DRAFT_303917 [Xylogone sp. PMI_703]